MRGHGSGSAKGRLHREVGPRGAGAYTAREGKGWCNQEGKCRARQVRGGTRITPSAVECAAKRQQSGFDRALETHELKVGRLMFCWLNMKELASEDSEKAKPRESCTR